MSMREPVFTLLPRPKPVALAGRRVLVLGLGDTGLSVANWVQAEGGSARVADTRAEPPRGRDFSGELHAGEFRLSLLDDVDLLCISPGLSLSEGVVQSALARGIAVVGDVELFAWHVRAEAAARQLNDWWPAIAQGDEPFHYTAEHLGDAALAAYVNSFNDPGGVDNDLSIEVA